MVPDNNNNTVPAGKAPADFPEELKVKAREFFKRGEEVAYAQNFDYAIELYLDGLSFWPDTTEEGHKPLRNIALRRQAGGGKKSGLADGSKYKKASGKHPKDAMLKAEYLLSKDPANATHMQNLIKGSAEANYKETVLWMGEIFFNLLRQKEKSAWSMLVFLCDSYSRVEAFSRALQVCQYSLTLKPNDAAMQDRRNDLSAQATLEQGNYDGDSDFRDSIKDREGQDKLHASDNLVQSDTSRADAQECARLEYEENPTVPGKVYNYINTLVSTEKKENEDIAISILEKAYSETDEYRFKQRSSEIRIKQAGRVIRHYRRKFEKDQKNDDLRKKYIFSRQQHLRLELEHYKSAVANYPTDQGLKYEYAQRLLLGRMYDEAIPFFQEARNDPRHRIAALNGIGQCFFRKEWYADAAETFEQALKIVDNKEGAIAKELRYNLGCAYEGDENMEQALACFRKVAQIDFNYKDVKQRVDAMRKRQRENK